MRCTRIEIEGMRVAVSTFDDIDVVCAGDELGGQDVSGA